MTRFLQSLEETYSLDNLVSLQLNTHNAQLILLGFPQTMLEITRHDLALFAQIRFQRGERDRVIGFDRESHLSGHSTG